MKHRKKAPAHTCIYAICDHEKKLAYIWMAPHYRLRLAYAEHYGLRVEQTKEMFEAMKADGRKPPMYLLEMLDSDDPFGYNYCVAWAGYFRAHGYEILPKKDIEEHSKNITETQIKAYIPNTSFDELCAPEKVLFSNYGDRMKEESEREGASARIYITVSRKEYERIKAAAEKHDMSVAKFSHDRIMDAQTFYFGCPSIVDGCLDELTEDHELLEQILDSIRERGHYIPKDIDNIQSLVDDILDNVNVAKRAFEEEGSKIIARRKI